MTDQKPPQPDVMSPEDFVRNLRFMWVPAVTTIQYIGEPYTDIVSKIKEYTTAIRAQALEEGRNQAILIVRDEREKQIRAQAIDETLEWCAKYYDAFDSATGCGHSRAEAIRKAAGYVNRVLKTGGSHE